MDIRVLRYFIAVATQENISLCCKFAFISTYIIKTVKQPGRRAWNYFICARKSKNHFNRRRYVFIRSSKRNCGFNRKTEANFNQKSEIISGEIHIGAGETEAMQFIAQTIKKLLSITLTLNFIYIAATLMTLQQN